jgi:cell division septation protein DedD
LPPASGQPLRYTVHLSSFSKPANADALKAKIEEAGFPASVMEVTVNSKLWFRVVSGLFDDRSAAEAHSREIHQRRLVSETPYVLRM